MAGESRQAMIDAAATLFRRQGYDATSWRQITAASGAPAGSIGFLFPEGKEELAANVVVAVSATTAEQLRKLIEHDDMNPVDAIQRWIAASARILESSDFTDGCPIATLALETSHRSERIRKEIADSYDDWLGLIAGALGDTYGERAHHAAEIVLSAFEGALLLARARRTTAPLDTLAGSIGPLLEGIGNAPEHHDQLTRPGERRSRG